MELDPRSRKDKKKDRGSSGVPRVGKEHTRKETNPGKFIGCG
jgi:hypothetical protein